MVTEEVSVLPVSGWTQTKLAGEVQVGTLVAPVHLYTSSSFSMVTVFGLPAWTAHAKTIYDMGVAFASKRNILAK